jgi:uncharacterized membrane protein
MNVMAGGHRRRVGHAALWLMTLALMGAWGCSSDSEDGAGAEAAPDAADPSEEMQDEELLGPQRVTGFFLLGPDRRDFQACFADTELWVVGPAVPDLLDLHLALTPGVEAYEALFVDVLARLAPPPASGPGSELLASVEMLELRRVAFEGWGCREEDVTVIVEASGNEPAWTLRVREGAAELVTMEGTETFGAGDMTPSPDGWTVSGSSADGRAFTLSLAIEACRDRVSGAYSHLRSTLLLGDEELLGCAYLGVAADL